MLWLNQILLSAYDVAGKDACVVRAAARARGVAGGSADTRARSQVIHNTTSTSPNPINWRTASAISHWWQKNPPPGGLTKNPTFTLIKSPQLFQIMWFFR